MLGNDLGQCYVGFSLGTLRSLVVRVLLLSTLHGQGGKEGNKSENMCYADLSHIWVVPLNLGGANTEEPGKGLGLFLGAWQSEVRGFYGINLMINISFTCIR